MPPLFGDTRETSKARQTGWRRGEKLKSNILSQVFARFLTQPLPRALRPAAVAALCCAVTATLTTHPSRSTG